MFRREKGDTNTGLFDTTTEQGQGGNMSADTATATAPSSTVGALSNATAAVGTSSAAAPVASAAAGPARPAADTRSAPTPGASTFRPSNSPISSMGSRMPEAKTVTATSSSIGSAIGIEKSTKAGRRVLTVGNDILLKGEIATCDRLVIEGKVDATLNDVHTVEIAETGSFKGSANIEDAEISGLFEGDLVVRNRLVIYATGKVRGKISYGEIEIERGGELTGEIKTTTPQSSGSSPRPSRTIKTDDKVAA